MCILVVVCDARVKHKTIAQYIIITIKAKWRDFANLCKYDECVCVESVSVSNFCEIMQHTDIVRNFG